MRATVSIIFNPRNTLDLSVDVSPDASTARAARDWFDAEWVRLGCEPLRPSGKVLLLDKILGVVDAHGHASLQANPEAAREIAEQAVLAVDAQHVTIDLPGLSVGF